MTSRKCNFSSSEKPSKYIMRICLAIVDFPDSPAPFLLFLKMYFFVSKNWRQNNTKNDNTDFVCVQIWERRYITRKKVFLLEIKPKKKKKEAWWTHYFDIAEEKNWKRREKRENKSINGEKKKRPSKQNQKKKTKQAKSNWSWVFCLFCEKWKHGLFFFFLVGIECEGRRKKRNFGSSNLRNSAYLEATILLHVLSPFFLS